MIHRRRILLVLLVALLPEFTIARQDAPSDFKVVSFYSAREDAAHISFVHEANHWFSSMAEKYDFSYDTSDNWDELNTDFLAQYRVVIFLDSRPDSALQRMAFRQYMENGGAWMGFHFAAFALTPSAFPQNWDWYHDRFLGSGAYVSNTWKPTPAILHVEQRNHPATKHLPGRFKSSPNEWYRWEYDLRKNPDIEVMISIDPASFPLGTGPKASEIWHDGDYPVVWTNVKYNMIYINMGHNDMEYETGSNQQRSFTFKNKIQDRLVIDALLWLAGLSGVDLQAR